METVKQLVVGSHGPQILYTGGRQPPQGPQAAHPPPTSRHDGSPYKAPISSPPMGSRAGAGGFPAYPPSADGHAGGGGRYMPAGHHMYPTYSRGADYHVRANDRPLMLHSGRRPTIMGAIGQYRAYSQADIMPLIQGNPLTVTATTIDKNSRMKPIQQPLVIDTSTDNHSSRESTYNPQVEAISPTLPSDPRDESPLRSTKDDLLKHIEQVDREIAKAESSIAKLRKKETELEAAASNKESGIKAVEEDTKDTKNQSIAQIIYAQNRRKALESHTILDSLSIPSDIPTPLPLYHQPSDTEVYAANKRQYAGFKRRLLEYFKRRVQEKQAKDKQLSQTYSRIMAAWLKKTDKIENSKKHKEKVAKNRELFEKVFPELRKTREERERFSRVGARVKSDAEMEEIMDGLQEQENEDKKMRAYAVIPPIIFSGKQREDRFVNHNGLIDDMVQECNDHKNLNMWTDHEREIFREKYLQHPKNFVIIASYLEKKSVTECIQYYYSTKKKENYKLLVKRRIRRPRNKNANNQTVEVLTGVNPTGVTTRGSVAALRQTGTSAPGTATPPNQQPHDATTANGNIGQDLTTTGTVTTAVPTLPTGLTGSNSRPGSRPVTPVSLAVNTSIASGDAEGIPTTTTTTSHCTSTTTNVATCISTNTTTTVSSLEVREKDKENLASSDKPVRRERARKDEDKTKERQDSSDDEPTTGEPGVGVAHNCAVCKSHQENYGLSQRLGPGEAVQYGLQDSQLSPSARVCHICRRRANRRRGTQCPIPTCEHKRKVKKLRHFPSRWADLPTEVKKPIINELQIPSDVSKCCSYCYSRISRKLGADAEEPVDPTRWSEEDIEMLRGALKENGCHWSRVAEKLPSKTEGQCKSFYFNFKKKYKLDDVVAEYKKARGKGEGPPTVTDEEESGSSTSSCEEAGTVPPPMGQGSASDTTSAPSPNQVTLHNNIDDKRETTERDSVMKEPGVPPSSTQHTTTSVREDYDSSATASADENPEVATAGRESPEVQHIPNPGERSRVPPPSGHPKSLPPPQHPANQGQHNVRDIIFQTIEQSISEPMALPKPPPSKSPTITSILDNSRSFPPQQRGPLPPPQPGYRDSRLGPAAMVADPRAGLPSSAPVPADAQCEGLDLTVRKRDRSPAPPHQHPPPSHQPQPSHPHHPHNLSQPSRDVPTVTIQGGAELTITSKDPRPPRAHQPSNMKYDMDPPQRWVYDQRNKSPSTLVPPDSRSSVSLVHSTVTNATSSSSHHLVYGAPRPPGPPQPKPSKPSMAPPPPLNSSRGQQPPPQIPSATSAQRIPMKKDQHSLIVGSITQGTPAIVSVPMSQATRYDMMKPVEKGAGSITAGTPLPDPKNRGIPISIKDGGIVYEARGSGVEIIPRPPLNYERETYRGPRPPHLPSGPPSSAYSFPPGYPPYAGSVPRPPYLSETQNSSHQIAADYFTSQQMPNQMKPKDARVSPRGERRDHSPHPDPRDGRPVQRTVIDSRSAPAAVDIRAVDVRSLPGGVHAVDPRVAQMRGTDPRVFLTASHQGSYPYSMPPDVRVSRPSQSPAGRDATPTPPTSEPGPPSQYRSPGVSTATPPPRMTNAIGVIQQNSNRRPPSKPNTPHLVAPIKSTSPRTDVSDRYSPHAPRRSPAPFVPENLALLSNTADRYGPMDMRRDGRPPMQVDKRQLEGFEQQLADSVRARPENRPPSDHDKHDMRVPVDRIPPDDRRYYPQDRYKDDPRMHPKNSSSKEELESNAAADIVAACFQKDAPKPSPSPNRTSKSDTLTAANLIDAIITHQISHNSVDGNTGVPTSGAVPVTTASDPRTYRRDDLLVVEMDKRGVRSPAIAPMHHKDKDVIMVEDRSDGRPPPTSNHKEGLPAGLHPVAMPHSLPANTSTMKAHMESIIHREFQGDGRKAPGPPTQQIYRGEIMRGDNRGPPGPGPGSGGPPAVTVSQYDHWKRHPHEKEVAKDRIDSRSPHRPPSNTPGGGHHLNAPMGSDERQIIRIAQPGPGQVSPRPGDRKMRTPPVVPGSGNVHVEPISPPTSSQPPTSEYNHSDANKNWQTFPKRSSQGPSTDSKEVFDYVRYKIVEVMRTSETQEEAQRRHDDGRHPLPNTPVSQSQGPPSQNAHHEDEPAKKRPRLEGSDTRPPSRPQSTGGAPREEGADSPNSGEMVIDENPRGGSSVKQVSGSGGVPKVSPTPGSGGSQYPYPYPGYRGHGPQGAVPPTTSSSGVGGGSGADRKSVV